METYFKVEKYDIIQSKCWEQQQHPARQRSMVHESHKEMFHRSRKVLNQVHLIIFATSPNEHTQFSCVNSPIPFPREK